MTNKEFLVAEFEKLKKDNNGFICSKAWEEYRYMLLEFTDRAETLKPEDGNSPVLCHLKNGEELTVYNLRQLVFAAYIK